MAHSYPNHCSALRAFGRKGSLSCHGASVLDCPIQTLLTTHDGIWRIYLIDYLRVYVPLKNFSLIWRRHHCQWRAAKFRPMLGAQGLWTGRGLYRDTGLQFFRFHPKDNPPPPPIQPPLTTHEGVWKIYSNPNPHGKRQIWKVKIICDH
jgi:hypothetical protein